MGLGLIGSEFWFPWQPITPIELRWGKSCKHSSTLIFVWIFFILVDKDNHNISDDFDQIRPKTAEIAALERLTKTLP